MPYVVTHVVLTRRNAYGRPKRYEGHVVHEVNARTWEGAHYQDPAKAWAFCQAINERESHGPLRQR